ncbi:hypothetical protein ABZV58_11510 [Nocardia sp. NPDC004654]|uniref:hypothetical protein n=1 Tax=Nocardia sp. NPDC004654 TaxID=3154776 RepID=UPI0033BB31EB
MTTTPQTATGSVVVDPGALQAMAGKLRLSAATIGNNVKAVTKNDFGPDQAGREYRTQGTDIHDGLVRVAKWLANWQQAAEGTADAMGQSAVSYMITDDARATELARFTK